MKVLRAFGRTGVALSLAVAAAAPAGADSGDRYYLHYDVLERAAVEAATKNPETWRDHAAGVENEAIALAAEEVTITLHAEHAEIEAVFDFENTAAAPRDVEMCFPVSYGMLGADAYDGRDESFSVAGRSADLTVTLEGVAVSYDVEAADEGLGFPALACWPVHFDAGARRRIVCRYEDAYNGGGGMMLDLSLIYVLYTGATWKGPIGRGKIVARPGDDFDWSVPLYYLAAGMPPARDDGAAVVWEFENLEPPFKAALNAPAEGSYYPDVEPSFGGLRLGFIKPSTMENGYAHSSYQVPEGPGAPAGALVDGLNFRTEPSADAPRVEGKPTFARREGMVVHERRGEWYRAEAHGGFAGWVRWRYVDPDTGREHIYVELALTCE